jgi:hypothetical protein
MRNAFHFKNVLLIQFLFNFQSTQPNHGDLTILSYIIIHKKKTYKQSTFTFVNFVFKLRFARSF